MKKLVFTAIAVIAFSGVSMAKVKVSSDSDCLLAKFVAYNDARAAGFSVEDSRAMSYSVYFTCKSLDQSPG